MRVDFERIKAATDIVAVVQSYGIRLKRAGQDYVGLCPFHEDSRPSLRVTPAKGLFRCPACHAAGNVIQFVAKKESLTEREAALKLCGSIPGVSRGNELASPPLKGIQVDDATRGRLLERVVGFYAKTLYNKDRAGLEYLKTRRLDDPGMLETFGVGYCNGTLRNALPKTGLIIEQLQALGILNDRGTECFYGRVVVPIWDAVGKVCGLYGRRITEGEPRHLYLRGEHRGVFNGTAAKTNQTLIITEAIFDAMSLWAAGYRNAISLYGKDGWTVDHEGLVREHGVAQIVLALDGDERGQAAAGALAAKLAGAVKSVERVRWPDGVKDANAFFLSRPAQDFAALLPASLGSAAPEAAGKEELSVSAEGFALVIAGRRYELCAIERPSAARLKATIKALPLEALGQASRLFHIDTVDFYLSRSRKTFVAEAARLFREMPETIEADVNRLTVAAEDYVKERLGKNTGYNVTLPDADRLEGMRMGRSAGLVDELQRDFGKLGVIGEEPNRLLLYLAMTSRKTDDPLAVQILSSSGAGKSHLQDVALSLCPEEELIKLTSLTGQALFYKGQDSLRHKCLAIAEVAGAEGARYALRNLISDKKLVIESTIKNALSGRLETQVNTVHGPTAVFETTTNPATDPETKSRYVLLSVDESPEQTRAILEAQRHSHTLEGRKRGQVRAKIMAKHHAFQRLLEPVAVVNPFEPLLSYGDDRLAFRRDHPKYLNLILAVTFLHQMQRPRKHDAELGDYIETTLDDIAIANDLAHELFGQSLDDLSIPSREALERITEYVERRGKETAGEDGRPVEFSRRELREVFGWSDTRLRVYLHELVEMEYLAPVSGRNGLRYSYRLMGGGAPCRRRVPGLKDVETLRQEAHLAGIGCHPAAGNGHPAATSPVTSGEVVTRLYHLKRNGYERGHAAPPLVAGKDRKVSV
jgi:DNA primase catalytic core